MNANNMIYKLEGKDLSYKYQILKRRYVLVLNDKEEEEQYRRENKHSIIKIEEYKVQ